MTKTLWAAAALVTTACMNSAQAAEKILDRDIPVRVSPSEEVLAHRGIQVTTLDGKKHGGRRLRIEFDHVRVFHRNNSWEDIPNVQISRIKVTQNGRFFHHLGDSARVPLLAAQFACGGLFSEEPIHLSPKCAIPVVALFSPVWVYTAATAPFYLAADAGAFLLPPRVYKIVH